MRAMFTAFMGDASNIMSFYGDVNVKGGVGNAVEWWIFKQEKSGQQVVFTPQSFLFFLSSFLAYFVQNFWNNVRVGLILRLNN